MSIKGKSPLVSICCTTYNHEKFVRKAIDGFLIQQTNFDFEIIIHDDASTDSTADIIRTYEDKYPDLFVTILQTKNQYSQGIKPWPNFVFPKAKGKYIALCEGDDYWTDPTKLQRQVDFLESNPDYVITYHDAIIVDIEGNILSNSKMDDSKKKDYSSRQLIEGSTFILTMSMCFRNVDILKNYPIENKYVKNGDNFLTAILGLHGKGKFLHEIKPSVYLRHNGGVWSSLSTSEKKASKLNSYFWIYQFFMRKEEKEAKKAYLNKIAQLVNKSDENHNLILVRKGFFSKIVSLLAKLGN